MAAKWAGPDDKGCHATYREHMVARGKEQFAAGRSFRKPPADSAPAVDAPPPPDDRRTETGTLAARESTDTLVGRAPGYDRRAEQDEGPPKERRRPWRRSR